MINAIPFSALIFEPETIGPTPNGDFVPNVDELAFVPSLKKLVFITAKSGYDYEYTEVPMVPNKLYYHTNTLKLYYWNAISEKLVETSIPNGDTVSTANMLEVIDIGIMGNNGQPSISFEQDGIVVFKNFKYVGCTLTGNNTQVVATLNGTIFSQCIFQGTFCYSNLKATNFGCEDGITETSLDWYYAEGPHMTVDLDNDVKLYSGNDNTPALTSIGQFCSGSDHVKIEFNGDFFSAFDTQTNKVHPITITAASDLELFGSSQPTLDAQIESDSWASLKRMVTGFSLVNCVNVDVHHLSFIGLHSPHVFPPRYYDASSFDPRTERGKFWSLKLNSGLSDDLNARVYTNNNGTINSVTVTKEGYTTQNCYKGTNQGDPIVGLSISGVTAKAVFDNNAPLNLNTSKHACCGISVHDCNFTMRSNGVLFGDYSISSIMRDTQGNYTDINSNDNMEVYNCRADHIFWQPIGFHCSNGRAHDFYIDYCGQPIDISTLSNHCTVENVVAKSCGCGPKQECNTGRINGVGDDMCRSFTHDNIIRNCDIEINDDVFTVDTEQYILNASRGASRSHFVVEGCKFTVYSRKKSFVGVELEDENITIRDTDFFIDVQTKWNLTDNILARKPESLNKEEEDITADDLEPHSRYIYNYSENILNADLPKLFFGNKWNGWLKTNLNLDNVTVNASDLTSISKAFSDIKHLSAFNVHFKSGWQSLDLLAPIAQQTLSDARKIDMYLYKVQRSRFRLCEFAPTANYFAHTYNNHVSIIQSSLSNLGSIAFSFQTVLNGSDSMSLELVNNSITDANLLLVFKKTTCKFGLYCSGNIISALNLFKLDIGDTSALTHMSPSLFIDNNKFLIKEQYAFLLSQGFAGLLNDDLVHVLNNYFYGHNYNGNCLVLKGLSGVANNYLRQQFAHLFWHNTFLEKMEKVDTGPENCRPLNAYLGMIYYNTSYTPAHKEQFNGSTWDEVN